MKKFEYKVDSEVSHDDVEKIAEKLNKISSVGAAVVGDHTIGIVMPDDTEFKTILTTGVFLGLSEAVALTKAMLNR